MNASISMQSRLDFITLAVSDLEVAEVDGLLARAQAAGARLTAPAHERPWGV